MRNSIGIFSALLLSFCLMFVSSVSANDITKKARIDLYSPGVVLKPVEASKGAYIKNVTWGKKEMRSRYLTSESPKLMDGKATTFTVSFTPEQDGKVSMHLMSGIHRKDRKLVPTWIYFTDLKIEGAVVKNLGFAETNTKGKAKFWAGSNQVLDGTGGLEGKKCVKAWHNDSCRQKIDVKAGQEVKITATVMPAQ